MSFIIFADMIFYDTSLADYALPRFCCAPRLIHIFIDAAIRHFDATPAFICRCHDAIFFIDTPPLTFSDADVFAMLF